MDGYASRMIARGPTLTEDGEQSTGSLHIVDLPDVDAARTFAFDEPYFRAGVFESVRLHRFVNRLGTTMWDYTGAVEGYRRFLVISGTEIISPHLIAYGELLALDSDDHLGRAALLEAPDREAAGSVTAEVHPWRAGGRPAAR